MDNVIKISVVATFILVIIITNVIFIRLFYSSFFSERIHLAPIHVVRGGSPDPKLDETLARMVAVRLADIENTFKIFQADTRGNNELIESESGIYLLYPTKSVKLSIGIFDPGEIKIDVAGVDVGGIISRLERIFINEKILNFDVSIDGSEAFIVGNMDALGPDAKPHWARLKETSLGAIADNIASTIVQRSWGKERKEIREMTMNDFQVILQSMQKMMELNRKSNIFGTSQKIEYIGILKELIPITEKFKTWTELNYFAMMVARGAGRREAEYDLYTRIDLQRIPPHEKNDIESRLVALKEYHNNLISKDKKIYTEYADYANDKLAILFRNRLEPPTIKLISKEIRNTYWDGTAINIPPGLGGVPDAIYRESSWRYIQSKWNFKFLGQAGAIANSYADVLTVFLKQTTPTHTDSDEDWEIGNGFVAWMFGRPDGIENDRRPLRSLKTPNKSFFGDGGAAGKTPNIRDIPKGSEASWDIYDLAGIGNLAFYEISSSIGIENAIFLWVDTLGKLSPDTDYKRFSEAIKRAAELKYGRSSKSYESVSKGWAVVGL